MELVKHRQLPDGTCICHSDHRVAEVRAAARAPICPECRDGKHRNCDGTAWDDLTGDLPVTASIGVAGRTGSPDETPADLLGRADALLYRAKKQGRNRVLTHGV